LPDGRLYTTICPFILHRGNGKFIPQFQRHWAKATKAAGCPGRLLHNLRRFAVRNLIHANVPMQVAKKWSGHESDAVFNRHGILDKADDLRKAAELVREYRAAKAEQEKAKAVAIR